MSEARMLLARQPVCTQEVCITCSDQLLAVVVEEVTADGALARGRVDGSPCEISVELIDGVAPGDVVLAQAGVGLQRLETGEAGR